MCVCVCVCVCAIEWVMYGNGNGDQAGGKKEAEIPGRDNRNPGTGWVGGLQEPWDKLEPQRKGNSQKSMRGIEKDQDSL